MKGQKILFSKKSDNWETPLDLYNWFIINKGFFDPCPINPVRDGLKIDWKEKTFVNPPYSNIRSWLEKGFSEFNKSNCKKIVFLIPARTCTKWFHELVYKKDNVEIEFIKGRLKFGNGKNSAPFPSMYVTIKHRGRR